MLKYLENSLCMHTIASVFVFDTRLLIAGLHHPLCWTLHQFLSPHCKQRLCLLPSPSHRCLRASSRRAGTLVLAGLDGLWQFIAGQCCSCVVIGSCCSKESLQHLILAVVSLVWKISCSRQVAAADRLGLCCTHAQAEGWQLWPCGCVSRPTGREGGGSVIGVLWTCIYIACISWLGCTTLGCTLRKVSMHCSEP